MPIDPNCPLLAEAKVAFEAAREAALLCAKIRKDFDLNVTSKSDSSPVTLADICAEVVINERLRKAFPNDCIIGEEDETDCSEALLASLQQHIPSLTSKQQLESILQSPQPDASSTRYWAVDPIDGTKGYIRGDQYAVCIALVDGASLYSVLAALGCPNLMGGVVLIAIRDFGVFRAALGEDFSQLESISEAENCDSLQKAHFTGAFESAHTKSTELAQLMEACSNTLPLLKIDSQCKYALLALGTAQVYYRRHASGKGIVLDAAEYIEAIWDNAPGVLFVEEAGGLVTDFAGNRLTFPPAKHFKVVGGIVASTLTPELHAELVLRIRSILQLSPRKLTTLAML